MKLDTNTTEAQRWAKFPATLLFATGLLWLLESLLDFNLDIVGQQTETGVGALGAFINFAVIPLGCVIIALGMLFVQRWALLLGPLFLLYPLVSLTIRKAARIQVKFAEFHGGGAESSFGDGVMTSLLLVAMWATFVMMVVYVLKSLCLLRKSQQWLSQPSSSNGNDLKGKGLPVGTTTESEFDGEICSLFPAQNTDDD